MVKATRLFLITLCCISVGARAQKVDLRGTVLDKYTSAPVPKAEVTLAKAGLSATTDSLGRFRLLNIPTGLEIENPLRVTHTAFGTAIAFHAGSGGDVSLRVFNPSGKSVLVLVRNIPEAGDWEIGLNRTLGPGLHFLRIQGPGFRQTVKLMGMEDGARTGTAPILRRNSDFRAVGKTAAGTALDSISVSKAGYRRLLLPIASLVDSGVGLAMSDTTVSMGQLIGLAPSIGNFTPPTLNPGFSPDIHQYDVTVPYTVTFLQLTPYAAPAKPYIRINGNLVASGTKSDPIPLPLGRLFCRIDVVSEDSSASSIYQIMVDRTFADSAILASLSISAGALSPSFSPGIFDYSAVIPAGVAQVTVTARPNLYDSKMTLNEAVLPTNVPSAPIAVDPAPKTIILAVRTAIFGDSVEKLYTIRLSRFVGTGSDVTLKNLVLSPANSSLKPFHPDTLLYRLTAEPLDSLLDITATLNDPAAILTIRGTPQASGVPWRKVLRLGLDTFDIVVTSPDMAQSRKYRLIANRPGLMATPKMNGSGVAFLGTQYVYTATPASLSCGSGMGNYRYDFGDGSPMNSFGANFMTHTWNTIGVFKFRVQTSCQYLPPSTTLLLTSTMSVWSDPLTVTVLADSTAQHPVKKISGYRPVSETWHPETTYVVTAKTRFDTAAVLTILPGTQINFMGDTAYLNVARIQAIGTETDSIVFRAGEVRIQRPGALERTFNSDGSYRTGPRFEYCSFPQARIFVDQNPSTYGGNGFYLKNSNIATVNGEPLVAATGTYIGHCRIGSIDSVRLFMGRVENSYVQTLQTYPTRSYDLEIHRCDIGKLSLPGYEFDKADITGNTIRSFFCGAYAGKLSGNNLLPNSAIVATIKAVGIDMRGNYWGPEATAEMDAKGDNQNISVIRDIFDDVTLGKVDYSGWLPQPVANTLPDW